MPLIISGRDFDDFAHKLDLQSSLTANRAEQLADSPNPMPLMQRDVKTLLTNQQYILEALSVLVHEAK